MSDILVRSIGHVWYSVDILNLVVRSIWTFGRPIGHIEHVSSANRASLVFSWHFELGGLVNLGIWWTSWPCQTCWSSQSGKFSVQLTFWTWWFGQFGHLVDRLVMSNVLVRPIGQVWCSVDILNLVVRSIWIFSGPVGHVGYIGPVNRTSLVFSWHFEFGSSVNLDIWWTD